MSETWLKTGPVSHDEAAEILQRFIHSHFHGRSPQGERARFSIPVDFKRDDDVRMQSYIDQQRATASRVRELEEALREMASDDLWLMDIIQALESFMFTHGYEPSQEDIDRGTKIRERAAALTSPPTPEEAR